jgi:hypothetical protein
MHNVVQRRISLTPAWQPLSALPLIASVDVSCLPQNVGMVWFQGDDGSEVPWLPGEWHQFQRIDLGSLRVRGSVGDALTVIGGTW